MLEYGKPVQIRFAELKEKIDQVGFTLDRIEIEAFGRVEEPGGTRSFILDRSLQPIPLRVSPVAEDMLSAREGALVWVRAYVHGWRETNGKLHLSLSEWRLPSKKGEN